MLVFSSSKAWPWFFFIVKSQFRNSRFGLECGLSSMAENEEARGPPPPFLFHTEWPCLSVLSCIVALVHDSSALNGNVVLGLDLQGAPRSICLVQWPFRLLTMWGVIGRKPTNYLCLKPAASHNSDVLAQSLVCWHKRLL